MIKYSCIRRMWNKIKWNNLINPTSKKTNRKDVPPNGIRDWKYLSGRHQYFLWKNNSPRKLFSGTSDLNFCFDKSFLNKRKPLPSSMHQNFFDATKINSLKKSNSYLIIFLSFWTVYKWIYFICFFYIYPSFSVIFSKFSSIFV